MSSDIEWEKWAQQDPYFAVLTNPRFRATVMTDDSRSEFFSIGKAHVDQLYQLCRTLIDRAFAPARILDFGCGVGRILIPLAQTGAEVVGVDISPTMLQEARRNCDAAGASGVRLVGSDDSLSQVEGDFDLVHSCIVIQHIEISRGLRIFQELVRRVRPGGIGALHVTFAWDYYRDTLGVAPAPQRPPPLSWWRRWRQTVGRALRGAPKVAPTIPDADPEMQMNFYNLSQLMFILQQAGAGMVHSQLTDHGGAIGAFMFFSKPRRD